LSAERGTRVTRRFCKTKEKEKAGWVGEKTVRMIAIELRMATGYAKKTRGTKRRDRKVKIS